MMNTNSRPFDSCSGFVLVFSLIASFFSLADVSLAQCPQGGCDNDGDGYAYSRIPVLCRDLCPLELDCNDSNPEIYPGAPELCNGIDDDCDGDIPADELDSDGDGYLDCQEPGWSSAEAQASVQAPVGSDGPGVSILLAILLLPVGTVVALRILRRKR
jgi:hypothetical protein